MAGLSVVVAIATTYALMLPGITMEREAQCGVEAHQHTEACYTANLLCTQEAREATAVEHISLNCTFQPHEHTSECYTEERELGCGQSTEYFHRHDEMCVDAQGELICTLKEKIKRNHTASCYEEVNTLICETLETEGHQHTEDCYTQVAGETPSCGVEESNGHTHTEECNATVLTCTVEENTGHVHTEACKETKRELSCTEAEVEAHSHGEGCYENINELSCGKAEGEGAHNHGEGCYISESTLACSKAEGEGAHTHGEGCYTEESTLTCTDEAHEHDGNSYATSKKLTCSTQESAGHAHGEGCYTQTQKLNCNTEESAGHAHGESCYTARSQLVCTKAETAGHTHGDACYTTSESIICGMEEGQGSHAHDTACYTTSIACSVEEGAGAHQHNESCYGVTSVLSCGQEAGAGAHTHGEECYETEKVRVCDHDELHKHDNSCFVTDQQNKRWAVCGYAELMEHQHTEACVTVETVTTEGHAHGETCYELVLHCTQEEHTHTDACYPDSTEEPTETPSAEPTATVEVTEEPTEAPSAEPTATVEVTEEPTEAPSAEPTATVEVTEEPTETPSAEPTATVEVTEEPTEAPSAEPTATVEVTEEPTETPSAEPTATVEVTEEPTEAPSAEPTATVEVTEEPTEAPSAEPTATVEATEEPAANAAPGLMQSVGMANNTLLLATSSDLETVVSYCCGLEEHIHDEACLDENWNIVCDLEYHAHTEDCCHACGLAAHTHSTSSVQGGIMLLDEGSSGCYDAEGNLICGLEEHTHTEACSLASEDSDAQSETTSTGEFTLSGVETDVTYNSVDEVLDLSFFANYSISVTEAKKHTSEATALELQLEGINAEQLVEECISKGGWLQDSAGKGMNYRFVKDKSSGTYAMEIYYDEVKLPSESETVTGTISFNASMDGESKNADGDYSISVGEQEFDIPLEDIYGETPSETLNYDMTVSKTGNVSLMDSKLTYTITVSTTKGFPAVNIKDVITVPEGLTLTGNPVIKEVKLEKWGNNYTTTNVKEYTQPSNQDITLILPGITLNEGETGGQYVITVEYPIGDIGVNETINDVKNTVEATATDNQQEFVTDSAEHTMTITSTAVSKSGRFDSTTNQIIWTIVVNAYNQDIAGAMVKDLGFLEALGLEEDVLNGGTTESDKMVVVLTNEALKKKLDDNFKISPDSNVSLVKQGEEYFLRFEAGENNANTDKYTINYSTAAEPDMMGSSVTNSYTYVQGDTKVGGDYTVTIPPAGSVTKTNSVATTTDLSAIEIDWTSTIELPAGGIPVEGVIVDTLDTPYEWINEQKTTVRWFTWDQLNSLFTGMKTAEWWKNEYTIEVKTVDDAKNDKNDNWVGFDDTVNGTEYYAWRVNVNGAALVPQNGNSTITLKYSSMLNAAVKNTTSVLSKNMIKAGVKEAWSEYKWSERVTKMNGNWNASDSNTTVTEEGNYITWIVDVYVDDEYEEIVVTDVIPSVTREDGTTVKLELYQIKTGQYQDGTFTYTEGTVNLQSIDSNGVTISATNVQNDSVSVTLKKNTTGQTTWIDEGKNFQVYFYYKLPEAYFTGYVQTAEEQKIAIGTFKNTAGVTVKKPNGDSSAYGGDDQSQTITVVVPALPQVDYAQFGKTGEYRDFVKAEESNTGKAKENVLEYTVDINKLAADLNDSGDTITVVDELNYGSTYRLYWNDSNHGNHNAAIPVSASLDKSSVKLYVAQRDANGELLTNADGSLKKGFELSKDLWSMVYVEQPMPYNTSVMMHTMSLTVPDEEAFVLEYTYEIDIDIDNAVVNCGCNVSVPREFGLGNLFTNKLKYNNAEKGSHSTDSNDVWKASSSSVTMNVAMSIQKVDENNGISLLDGAKFTVYKWDSSKNDFVATEKVYTTVDGTFRIQQKEDGFEFAEDTAYYIVETEAPFGYVLPASPEKIYFYFASGTQDATLSGPEDFPGSYHELSKGGEELVIPNAKYATSVNVTKMWNGNGTQPESVDVYLYRYALTEDQWKKLNEQEAEDAPQVNTYTVTFTLTDYQNNTTEQVTSGSIQVYEGDTVLIDFGTTYAAQGDQTAIMSLTKNGEEIKEQVSGQILRIENIKENIVLVGATNWTKGWWNKYKISMTTESGSTGSITVPNVYTPATLAALEGKQLDSSFSRVLTLKGDSWSGSVSNLDLVGKDANGETVHYVYFIEEEPVAGWSSEISGGGSDEGGYNYTLTNTYDQSSQTQTSLAVSKVWLAADGTQLPEEQWQDVHIQLYRENVMDADDEPALYVYNGYNTFAINENTGWAMNFTDLPHKVLKGDAVVTEYKYSVREITTGNFATVITYDDKTATITNKVVEEPTEIYVKKNWVGDATTSVKVYLRRYKQTVSTAEDDTETLGTKEKDVTFNDSNEQYITLNGTTITGSFTNLEKSATVDGTKYNYLYYVEEDADDAANYTVTYEKNDGVEGNTAETPIVITNTQKADTSLTVTKVWQDADGQTVITNVPESVSFTLWQVAGENRTQYPDANTSYTLNASEGWSMTFDDLPQSSDDGSVSYTYEVQETAMDGYVTTYAGNNVANGNITIINKATRLTIEKKWLQADGTTSWTEQNSTVVYLQVSKDGTALGQLELQKNTTANVTSDGYLMITGANSVTLDKLPLGNYTVKEVGYRTDNGTTFIALNGETAPDWKVSYSENGATLSNEANTGSLTVTNTARTSLTVTKQWEGLAEGENPPYTVYLRVKDSNGSVIDPAKYGVTTNTHTYTAPEEVTETWLVYTGKGSITLHDLPVGSYTVEEVAYKANEEGAAIQLIADGDELPFDITLPETVTLGTTGTLSVVNAVKPETGEITVKKAWSSGTTVPSSIDVQLVQIATPVDGVSNTPGNVEVTFQIQHNETENGYITLLDKQTLSVPAGSDVVWNATFSHGDWWSASVDECSVKINGSASSTAVTRTGNDPYTYTIDVGEVNASCTVRLEIQQWLWGNQHSDQADLYGLQWRHSYSIIEPDETVYQTFALTAADYWSKVFTGLPLVSEDGKYTYTYRVEEVGAGYQVSYSNNDGIREGTITVTNDELKPLKFPMTVKKIWTDASGNVLTNPPNKITIQVWEKGNETTLFGTYDLTAPNWEITVEGLNLNHTYYIEETDVTAGSVSQMTLYDVSYRIGENGEWKSAAAEAANPIDNLEETMYIRNQLRATYTLPETGGGGTQWYTGGGAMLAGVALTLLYRGNKRKRRAEE